MDSDREANLLGQITGIVGVLSAVINALPPSARKQLPGRLHASFEPLIAKMLADTGADADAAREGAEMVRNTFLAALMRRDAE
jgi:hypothetical protein